MHSLSNGTTFEVVPFGTKWYQWYLDGHLTGISRYLSTLNILEKRHVIEP